MKLLTETKNNKRNHVTYKKLCYDVIIRIYDVINDFSVCRKFQYAVNLLKKAILEKIDRNL